MTTWTHAELSAIGAAEELQIAPLRSDGTLRDPVIIWVVRHGDDLYVRSYKGAGAAWFRGAQVRHEGRIWAGGIQKDVAFVAVADAGTNRQIDTAYRSKYRRYAASIIDSINGPTARAATIRLVPREAA